MIFSSVNWVVILLCRSSRTKDMTVQKKNRKKSILKKAQSILKYTYSIADRRIVVALQLTVKKKPSWCVCLYVHLFFCLLAPLLLKRLMHGPKILRNGQKFPNVKSYRQRGRRPPLRSQWSVEIGIQTPSCGLKNYDSTWHILGCLVTSSGGCTLPC